MPSIDRESSRRIRHNDSLARLSREHPPEVGGFNRVLPAASIHEHRELDGTRAAMMNDGVERCACGAARVEHIVYEQHVPVSHVNASITSGRGDGVPVVAVGPHIEAIAGDVVPHDLRDLPGERFRKVGATTEDPDDDHVFTAPVALDDLMREAVERARHAFGGEDPRRQHLLEHRLDTPPRPPHARRRVVQLLAEDRAALPIRQDGAYLVLCHGKCAFLVQLPVNVFVDAVDAMR